MKQSIRQALILALVFLGVYFTSGKARFGNPRITLEPISPEFNHDEFIEYTLRVEPQWYKSKFLKLDLTARVLRNGKAVRTIGEQKNMPFFYDEKEGRWTGKWPCPWNADEGVYQVELATGSVPLVGNVGLIEKPFSITGRTPAAFPNGFAVLTVEDLDDIRGIHWKGPNGERGDWRVLVDWAKFIGADALWILSADSGGYSLKPADDHPWNDRAPSTLRMLGKECHRQGIKFGVWAMCYLIGGTPAHSPNYQYAWEYDKGQLIDGREKSGRRAVSMLDPKRPHDIAKLLSQWAAIPEVDYVGLDYIRNALGGFEMVDEFVKDMRIPVPDNWGTLSKNERMLWLARKKVARKDDAFIDAWQWWRAHKTSHVIRTIKAVVGDKPLWVFTLSWDKGWQHGQDPIMFRDAGADMDAIMLYQCDKEQFSTITHDWERYLRHGQVNLLAGDCIDWILHQRDPAGPEEFKRRILMGYHHLSRGGDAKGVFFHDLLRALRGRMGPWTTQDWMKMIREVITEIKK